MRTNDERDNKYYFEDWSFKEPANANHHFKCTQTIIQVKKIQDLVKLMSQMFTISVWWP